MSVIAGLSLIGEMFAYRGVRHQHTHAWRTGHTPCTGGLHECTHLCVHAFGRAYIHTHADIGTMALHITFMPNPAVAERFTLLHVAANHPSFGSGQVFDIRTLPDYALQTDLCVQNNALGARVVAPLPLPIKYLRFFTSTLGLEA